MGTTGIDLPCLKQCYVTFSATIPYLDTGFVIGITPIIMKQLNETKYMDITPDQISWFASAPGFVTLFSTVLVSYSMNRFGRRKSIIMCILMKILGWVITFFAPNFATLMTAKVIQCIVITIPAIVTPTYIGECVSPKYRGSFLAAVPFYFYSGQMFSHFLAVTLGWKRAILVFNTLCCINLLMIYFSPESPSFLAMNKKYDQCKRTFRWLRGNAEERELTQLINNILSKEKNDDKDKIYKTVFKQVLEKVNNMFQTVKRKDFYKPVLLILVLYMCAEWSGGNIIDNYIIDIVHQVVGEDVNVSAVMYSIDIQRIITTILSIYGHKVIKRRHVIATVMPLNMLMYFAIAGYTYAKSHHLIHWDHPFIGILLLHLHMFFYIFGASSMQVLLFGELLPLQFKHIFGLICMFWYAIHFILNIKSFIYLITTIGLYGTYCLYGLILFPCLVVLLIYVPETKDRTLLDIESEFGCKEKGDETEGEALVCSKL